MKLSGAKIRQNCMVFRDHHSRIEVGSKVDGPAEVNASSENGRFLAKIDRIEMNSVFWIGQKKK